MANTSATAAVIKAATASIVATASTTEVAAVIAVMLEDNLAQDYFRTNQTVLLCDHVPVGFDYIVARKIPSGAVV